MALPAHFALPGLFTLLGSALAAPAAAGDDFRLECPKDQMVWRDFQWFSTLEKALVDAADGDDLVLCNGVHWGGLLVDDDVRLIGIGPGVLVVPASGGSALDIEANVELIGLDITGSWGTGPLLNLREDSAVTGLGVVVSEGAAQGIFVGIGASLRLESSAVRDNTGRGIDIDYDGGLWLEASEVYGNKGGGIKALGLGQLALNKSAVHDNVIGKGLEGEGGGLWVAYGRTVEGGVVYGNKAALGGGVFARTATVTDTILDGNTADVGGNVYVDGGAAATVLIRTPITNGRARLGGGIGTAISKEGSEANVSLDRVEIWFNAADQGGGVWLGGGSFQQMPSTDLDRPFSYIVSNTAGVGGGIYVHATDEESSSLWFLQIFQNEAFHGGGVAVGRLESGVTFRFCYLESNAAILGDGGALWIGDDATSGNGRLSLSNAGVSGNRADGAGGAAWLGDGASLAIRVASLRGNQASVAGGADVRGTGTLLTSDNVDWGENANDNVPDDVVTLDGPFAFGAAASFECTEDGCL